MSGPGRTTLYTPEHASRARRLCARGALLSHPGGAPQPAIGISLAEIAGIARSWPRPARAGPRDWHNACGNCGNPRHGPPARHRDRKQGRAERAERSETHFSGPIPVRKYSWDGHWKEKWHGRRPVRQLVGSWAGQWELADVGSMVPTYSGWPWRSSASHQKIPNLFNEGKLQTPGNGAYLFRPSASQSSDRDAQVGTVEIEGLARKHARFGGAVSRPSRSAARPALSAWPAWHPPRPARSSSAQGTV